VVLQVVPVGSSGFNFTPVRNSQQEQQVHSGLILPGRVRHENLEKPPTLARYFFLAGAFEDKDDGGILRFE